MKNLNLFRSQKPEDCAWRAAQAQVDADIEGLSEDPKLEKLVLEMEQNNIPVEQRIDRIKEYAKQKYAQNSDDQ